MLTPVVQRWRDRRGVYRPIGEPINPLRYEVAAIDTDRVPKSFIQRHHYSGTYPAARWRFGLYQGAALVGVAVFSHPCNDATLTTWFPGAATDSVELGRLVLLDEVPSNGESWFVARCFELLRREVLGVLSMSDPIPRTTAAGPVVFVGHIGNIYQALNGIYVGPSKRRTLRLLPDGSVLNERAISKIRKRDRGWRYAVDQLVRAGAAPLDGDPVLWLDQQLHRLTRPLRHPGNHRYLWGLDRQVKRHLPASQPYPKWPSI